MISLFGSRGKNCKSEIIDLDRPARLYDKPTSREARLGIIIIRLMESLLAPLPLISRIDSAVVNYLRRLQLIDFAAVNRLITLPRSREWIILLGGFITKLRSLTNSCLSLSLISLPLHFFFSLFPLLQMSLLKSRSSTRIIFDRENSLLCYV